MLHVKLTRRRQNVAARGSAIGEFESLGSAASKLQGQTATAKGLENERARFAEDPD
jgi:hypothetical protein